MNQKQPQTQPKFRVLQKGALHWDLFATKYDTTSCICTKGTKKVSFYQMVVTSLLGLVSFIGHFWICGQSLVGNASCRNLKEASSINKHQLYPCLVVEAL